MNRDQVKLAGGAVGAAIIAALTIGGIVGDRNQRALVVSGIYTKVTEAVFV